jgi:CBS domain-containing protein
MSSRTVQELLENKPAVIAIQERETVAVALQLMIEQDFSQLPVVNSNQQYVGLISNQSILAALKLFNTTLETLHVRDAISTSSATLEPDSDLFELLNILNSKDTVVVIDRNSKHVHGIVTLQDALNYLRQSTEDLMYSADIETTLKDFIEAIYPAKDDRDKIAAEVANPQGRLKDQSKAVLIKYLRLQGDAAFRGFDGALFNQACQELSQDIVVDYAKLTLKDYIDIWLQFGYLPSQMHNSLPAREVRNLLEKVRETRNDLAHLRPITKEQREILHYCAAWLQRQEPTLPVPSPEVEPSIPLSGEQHEEIQPLDEEPDRESRYSALGQYLQSLTDRVKEVTLTFAEIEAIINNEQQPTARQHRSWWANDSVGHVQSQEWINAGWRVKNFSISAETVKFAQINDRQDTYIRFFSTYRVELQKKYSLPLKPSSPAGTSWFNVIALPFDRPQQATLTVAFAKGNRFRVELYIDTGDRERNKYIFDELYTHRDEFQSKIDVPIRWERIDEKRASRVACYFDRNVSPTSSQELLNELCGWAVEHTNQFYVTLSEAVDKLLKRAS